MGLWIFLHLHPWWHNRGDGGFDSVQPADSRYVLRSGAFPLRAYRFINLPAAWRTPLLVPEDDRQNAPRGTWEDFVLAGVYRLQCDFLPNAYPRIHWNAPSGIHLS